MDDDRAVVDPVAVHAAARRRRAPAAGRRDAATIVGDRRLDRVEQGVLQEQVVDRVAGQAQLGEDRHRDAVVVAGARLRRGPSRRWPPGRRSRPAPCRPRPARSRGRRPSRSPRRPVLHAAACPPSQLGDSATSTLLSDADHPTPIHPRAVADDDPEPAVHRGDLHQSSTRPATPDGYRAPDGDAEFRARFRAAGGTSATRVSSALCARPGSPCSLLGPDHTPPARLASRWPSTSSPSERGQDVWYADYAAADRHRGGGTTRARHCRDERHEARRWQPGLSE